MGGTQGEPSGTDGVPPSPCAPAGPRAEILVESSQIEIAKLVAMREPEA
jgi:hypothetical protein